jgi:hypothetical protein
MKKLIALSLLCAAFMGVPARAQTQDTIAGRTHGDQYGSIGGYVFDSTSMKGVSSAKIRITGTNLWPTIIETDTDRNGRYLVKSVSVGERVVYVRRAGYRSKGTLCRVESGDTAIVHFRLKPRPRGEKEVFIGHPRSMIDYSNTGTTHTWSEEEINRTPGH